MITEEEWKTSTDPAWMLVKAVSDETTMAFTVVMRFEAKVWKTTEEPASAPWAWCVFGGFGAGRCRTKEQALEAVRGLMKEMGATCYTEHSEIPA